MTNTVVLLFPGAKHPMDLRSDQWQGWRVHAVYDLQAKEARSTVSDINTYFADVQDGSAISDLLASFEPARAIVVWPIVELSQTDDFESTLRAVMSACFCTVRSLVRPLMRQRNGCVWIASPTVEIRSNIYDSTPEQAVDVEACLLACHRGFAALAGALGMELAKKGVVVNYLQHSTTPGGSPELAKLICWLASEKRQFLTAEAVPLTGANL